MEKWRKVVRLYAFSLLAHRQWGTAGTTSHFPNKQCTFALPIAFPTACYSALATDTGGSTVIYGVEITSQSALKVYSSVNASDWGCAFVIAIGK